MSIQVEKFPIHGVLQLTPKRFGDARGYFSETYNARTLAGVGIADVFVQDNHSYSAVRGTVRGLHYQNEPRAQVKLVRVVRGAVLDVAVDLREGSPTYGRHVAAELSAENGAQLYIPVGFAHGFCTLVADTEIVYKVTDFYAPEAEAGLVWNDPDLAIAWPDFAGSVLADRDARLPRLGAIEPPFKRQG